MRQRDNKTTDNGLKKKEYESDKIKIRTIRGEKSV